MPRRAAHRAGFTSSGFASADPFSDADDVDPMAGVANLVDTMLVFACGILIALVTAWQLDLPNIQQVIQQREMTEVNDIEVTDQTLSAEGTTYNERGTVYEDPETGKLYMLTQDVEGTGDTGSTSGADGE